MESELRLEHPERTCKKNYSNYRSYKKFLRKDFNKKCGYCNDYDFWGGGPHNYHIDHFAPKSKFPQLKSEYNNLIYSCPFCNRSKGKDWLSNNPEINIVNNKGYIDPCDSEYHENFRRNQNGEIIPTTKIGKYMYKKLKLYLARHRIIWKLTKIDLLLREIEDFIEKNNRKDKNYKKLKETHFKLSTEYHKYVDQLIGELKYE